MAFWFKNSLMDQRPINTGVMTNVTKNQKNSVVQRYFPFRPEGDNYLGQLAKDVLQNNTYKAGNVFGRSAGWGLWSVEPASYNGVDCLKAVQGICSIEGQKGDVLGTLDIFFNYDSNGQIHVLDMKFHQNNPYEDLR